MFDFCSKKYASEKYASMELFKYLNLQVYKYAGMHAFKFASMQICNIAIMCYMQVYKYTSI